jgi:uncharacterized protein (DUF433 family)
VNLNLPDDDLIERHIVCRQSWQGVDDVRMVESGTPVWLVIDYDQSHGNNTDCVAHAYGLTDEAVEAARAYYRRHRDVIDARILIETTAFTQP